MTLLGANIRSNILSLMVVASLLVSGCQGSDEIVDDHPERTDSGVRDPAVGDDDGRGVFSEIKKGLNAINPFSETEEEKSAKAGPKFNATLGGGGAGIGVNTYLWRASLDTIKFMPLSSADPFGGVIITDWHSPEGVIQERFKMNVFILVRSLRADGVRVSIFRQVQEREGTWRDADVPVQTALRIEEAILTKARKLRSEFLRR